MLRLFALTVLSISSVEMLKLHDAISKSTVEVIRSARREQTARVCTCKEMSDCFDSVNQKVFDCLAPCSNEMNKYLSVQHPDKLRACFDKPRGFIGNMATCFRKNVKACVDNEEQARRRKAKTYDYHVMIRGVGGVITKQIQVFLNAISTSNIKVTRLNADIKV
uniref:Chondroitin proteoglycan 4 domain-containing protein n=1 Tax=Angiostrongylus cantonensis TaxID=6313 RepID=A0A0K0DM66_ANGCA